MAAIILIMVQTENPILIDNSLVTRSIKMQLHQLKTNPVRNEFPTEVFPVQCRSLIEQYCKCYGSAPEHYGLSMLTIAGAVIGNACWVKERGTEHPPMLYSVIVDLPGRGKTPIIKTILKPVINIEKEFRKKHAELLKQRQLETAETGNLKPLPVGKEIIMNDFTLESIYKVLQAWPRGVLVSRDEVIGWLNSMNQYRRGSDEQFWLENFNAGLVKINRQKSERPILIRNSFVSVIGSTQPAMLSTFASGDKAENGFLARILFSYPETTKKQAYTNITPPKDLGEKWEKIIQNLFDLPVDAETGDEFKDAQIQPNHIYLDSDASILYQTYYNEICNQVNNSDDEVSQAIITKYDSHVLRIALILRFLAWAESTNAYQIITFEYDTIKIDKTAMAGAIRLSNYFLSCSLKVAGRMASPVDRLAPNVQVWYNALPDEFIRADAAELAGAAQISERTMGRLLTNASLFKRLRQGAYMKQV